TGALERHEHRRLAIEAEDAAVDVRLAQQNAGVVDEVARREVIGAVDDNVVRLQDVEGVGRGQLRLVEVDLHLRVDRLQAVLRRLELGSADVGRSVQHLTLQIAEVDDVEVDQAEAAEARG